MPVLSKALVSSFWVISGIGTAAVALRFYSRWKLLRKRPDWGDAFCVLSMAVYITVAALVSWSVANGYARHTWEFPKPPPAHFAISSAVANTVNIQNIPYPKVALAFLLHELTRPPLLVTAFFYVLAACVVILSLVQTIVQAIPTFPHHTQGQIALGLGTISAIADLVYALYPSLVVWQSRIPKAQKIRISMLMSWGIFASVMSIIKIVKVYRIGETDRTYTVAVIILLQSIETLFLMLACTVPTMGPIARRLSASLGSFSDRMGRPRFTTALDSDTGKSTDSANREAQNGERKPKDDDVDISISVPREHAGMFRSSRFNVVSTFKSSRHPTNPGSDPQEPGN